MNENLVMQDIFVNQDHSTDNLSTSAGQMLKQARLDAGLHIAALAVSLRVPVKRIEALESGQMDLLPDTVFVRALTSSICQALKIDAQPILDKLPKAALPRLNRDDIAINTPIEVNHTNHSSISSWIFAIFTSPLLMGVLFLCAAALGLYLWPRPSAVISSPIAVSTQASIDSGVSQAKEIQVTNDSVQLPNLNTNTGVSESVNAVVSGREAASPKVEDVVNASLVTENIITFKASGETWVEVKSASGSSLFKKLLNVGETAGASSSLGAMPLTVIVGRADVTQVEVRGKPIDLVSIAKSNVARFEVK